MTFVTLQSRYIPLLQKPNCCAVTCLQMILYRNGCGLFDLEALAKWFGVKIDETDAQLFNVKLDIMTSANCDEGISTVESDGDINKFLGERKLPLRATAYKTAQIASLQDFLEEHLSADHDVWLEYHGDDIHADDHYRGYQGRYIHDSLIESIDLDKRMAVIVDPMPEHRQRYEMSFDLIEKAISSAYGKETGFIIIEKA